MQMDPCAIEHEKSDERILYPGSIRSNDFQIQRFRLSVDCDSSYERVMGRDGQIRDHQIHRIDARKSRKVLVSVFYDSSYCFER